VVSWATTCAAAVPGLGLALDLGWLAIGCLRVPRILRRVLADAALD
jgi:hypothetical protein